MFEYKSKTRHYFRVFLYSKPK